MAPTKRGKKKITKREKGKAPAVAESSKPVSELRTKHHHDPVPAVSRRRKAPEEVSKAQFPKKAAKSSKRSKATGASQVNPTVPPSGTFTPRTLMFPRCVDILDSKLIELFPELLPMFKAQGLLRFISRHRIYYPALVQEFFHNLTYDNHILSTSVRNVPVRLTRKLLHRALEIPAGGVDPDSQDIDAHEAYSIMTNRPSTPDNRKETHVTKLNANQFPPLQRLMHHIFTTIITPQGGGRERVSVTHRFLFYNLFKKVQISLPFLMLQHICSCMDDKERSLPYAAHLTAVFKLMDVPLENEEYISIPARNIYTYHNVHTFMKFKKEGDTVIRHLPLQPPVPPANAPEGPSSDEPPPVPCTDLILYTPPPRIRTPPSPPAPTPPAPTPPTPTPPAGPSSVPSTSYGSTPTWFHFLHIQFNRMETNLQAFEARLNTRFDQLESRINTLEEELTGTNTRITNVAEQVLDHSFQLGRLWTELHEQGRQLTHMASDVYALERESNHLFR